MRAVEDVTQEVNERVRGLSYSPHRLRAARACQLRASVVPRTSSATPATPRVLASTRVGAGASCRPYTRPAAAHVLMQIGQERSSPIALRAPSPRATTVSP